MTKIKNVIVGLSLLFCFAVQKSTAQSGVVDVSDVQISNPKPYRYEEAGYSEIDTRVLSTYEFKNGWGSTKLNQLIKKVSKKGGGIIKIPAGNYEFVQIEVKSNVHFRFEEGVVIRFPDWATGMRGEKSFFMIGRLPYEKLVKNVTFIGEGSPEKRPKFILRQKDKKHCRVFSFGKAKNVLVQNFSIDDELTLGSSIAFNLQKNGTNKSFRAKDVTITNVSMTGADQGYGLAQTNVGENILLKNLMCSGGMTCRIEAHTGRKYDIGTDNIVIQNVVSYKGKAAVLLQPHSVVNGRVLVEGAKSIGSAWVLFLKEGFVAKESKRRKNGQYVGSKMSGLSMEYGNNSAVLSRKNLKYIPQELKQFIGSQVVKDKKKKSTETGIHGPSVAPIFSNVKSYSIELPLESEIKVSGEDVDLRKKKILIF